MNGKVILLSYTLSAIAGICFVQGLAILSRGRGTLKHGPHEKIDNNTR